MTIMEHKWSALPVPDATVLPFVPEIDVLPLEMPIVETDF